MPRSVRRWLALACVAVMIGPVGALVDAPWRLAAFTAPALAVVGVPGRDPARRLAVAAEPWRGEGAATLHLPPGVGLTLPPPLPVRSTPPWPKLRGTTVARAALVLVLSVFVLAAVVTSQRTPPCDGFLNPFSSLFTEDCAGSYLALTPQLVAAGVVVLAGVGFAAAVRRR